MYIAGRFWNNYIGDTDDSITLAEFLEDQKKEEIPLSEIFAKLGLDRQNGDYHKTVEFIEFKHSSGVEKDFHFAISVILDLAAILLECRVRGRVSLRDLNEYNMPSRSICITATEEEHAAMNKAIADFVADPLSYDIHELVPDGDMMELAKLASQLRAELYEPDAKGEAQAEDNTGKFASFVLLSEPAWDKAQFVRDMSERWGVAVEAEAREEGDDSLVFNVDGMMCVVAMLPAPVPNGEAVADAKANDLWPEAVEVAQAHKAQILVVVLGENDLMERAKIHVKMIAVCCRQAKATAVFTNGVVLEPKVYERMAECMHSGEIPIGNLVWVGLVERNGKMMCYTSGLDVLGREELEVVDAGDVDPSALRGFLLSIVIYVLSSDVTLQDGETIGWTADDKHSITRSPGQSVPGMSLKISYHQVATVSDGEEEMDDAVDHLGALRAKDLQVDEIAAFNHMAIYLRWCIEHDMMSDEFIEAHRDIVSKAKNAPGSVDLRVFIRDELDGRLVTTLFTDTGKRFAYYYYGWGDANTGKDGPYFPSDIDDYSLRYFGPSRYYSDEFKDEAYLFIPFDDAYYSAMAATIDGRFEAWSTQKYAPNRRPSATAQAIMRFLHCECFYFPPMMNDDPIMAAYGYAKRRGCTNGFVPMLVVPSETLLEMLLFNSDGAQQMPGTWSPEEVANYRKRMISTPVDNGREILQDLINTRKREAEDDETPWDEILGKMEGGEAQTRSTIIWNVNQYTHPVILAFIPVEYPWEVFAYLPFGNWNECPPTEQLMACSKYWYEQYRAIPIAITRRELEYVVETPVPQDRARELSIELYGFCPDLEEGDTGIGQLSDSLWKSTVWSLWWH